MLINNLRVICYRFAIFNHDSHSIIYYVYVTDKNKPTE